MYTAISPKKIHKWPTAGEMFNTTVIKEIQIKTSTCYHFTPTTMATTKQKQEITGTIEDGEK